MKFGPTFDGAAEVDRTLITHAWVSACPLRMPGHFAATADKVHRARINSNSAKVVFHWGGGLGLRQNSMRVVLAAAILISPGSLLAQTASSSGNFTEPAGKDWPVPGGDWGHTRYTTLTQIAADNVKNLKGA